MSTLWHHNQRASGSCNACVLLVHLQALSKGENGALDVAVHLARREKHDPQRVACAMHRAAGICSSAAATSNVLAFARAVADAACLFTRSQLATLLHASARLSP